MVVDERQNLQLLRRNDLPSGDEEQVGVVLAGKQGESLLGMGKHPAVQRRRRVRRGGMTRLPEALKDIVARRFRQQQNTGEVPGRAKPCRFRRNVLEGAVEQIGKASWRERVSRYV